MAATKTKVERAILQSPVMGSLSWALSGKDLPATLWCLLPLLFLGFLLSLAYARSALPLMMGASALLAGAAIGFLFGIPRTVQSDTPDGDAARRSGSLSLSAQPRQLVNTSLEQISDWLVKIIVGVSLVQFKAILEYLQLVAATFAADMPPLHHSHAFAGGVLTYFGVLGFLSGYLLTRLFLSGAFYRALSELTERQVETIAATAAEQVDTTLRRATGLTAAVLDAVQHPDTLKLGSALPTTPLSASEQAYAAMVASDPWKGKFGGVPARKGRLLTATVEPIPGDKEFCHVHLETRSTDSLRKLVGPVKYFLHPTFGGEPVVVFPVNGVASLDRLSWGAFTVGAETDDGTLLELDLADVDDAPEWFRER